MSFVGMPAAMHLEEFGSQVWAAFDYPPYLVGSALTTKQWRDVDVRLMLPDEIWASLGLGEPEPHMRERHGKWVSLIMAYSALGKIMTGLPIDFQIQQQTQANETYHGPRTCLGCTPLRTLK